MARPKGNKGFDAFESAAKPKFLIGRMTAKNTAVRPEGFERMIASRPTPLLDAEVTLSQTLKSGRNIQKQPVGLARFFKRRDGYSNGDKE